MTQLWQSNAWVQNVVDGLYPDYWTYLKRSYLTSQSKPIPKWKRSNSGRPFFARFFDISRLFRDVFSVVFSTFSSFVVQISFFFDKSLGNGSHVVHVTFSKFRISIFWSSLGSIFPHFNPNQRLKNWYHFTFFIIALEKIIFLFDSVAPSYHLLMRAPRDLHPHHIMPSWATIPWCRSFHSSMDGFFRPHWFPHVNILTHDLQLSIPRIIHGKTTVWCL